MKILILTQIVDKDDELLGVFLNWIENFAKKFSKVTVICLKKGDYDLPDNVKVYSLGKEGGSSRWKYITRFYKYIWQTRKSYDAVFVHMNPEYVIMGGFLWRLMGKKISMWYAHKKGSYLRRVALFLAHRVFSVSKESFVDHKSKKFRPLGHGIDVDIFNCDRIFDNKDKKIISVGRLSPVKEYEILLHAVDCLVHEFGMKNFTVDLIGGPARPEDKAYVEKLHKIIDELKLNDYIRFLGPMPNKKVRSYLCEADIFASMQLIGGAGKGFLEAMSCGVLAVVGTPALNKDFGTDKEYLFYDGSSKDMAEKLKKCLQLGPTQQKRLSEKSRNIVKENHNLDKLVDKIKKEFDILCVE